MAPGGGGTARSSDLVGRRRELAKLGAEIDEAHGGRPRTVLLTGEAGVGKTALVTATAEEAAERGFTVVWARAWGASGAPPFWPWTQVLRSCQASDAGQRALGECGKRELAVGLAESGRDETARAPGDRFAVFDAVSQVLHAWTASTPVMLVLEDLHWADEGTWQLALFVARNSQPGSRLALVATCRDTETRLDPELADLSHRFGREASHIALRTLTESDTGRLFTQVCGHALADDQLAQLHNLTGGNPLFVEELARLAAADSAAGGVEIATLLASPDVPAADATIRRVYALAGDRTQALLQTLAVAGGVAPLGLVARLGHCAPNAVTQALGPADSLGVVTIAADTIAFRHELFRRVVYDSTPSDSRDDLHRALGEALADIDDEANLFAIADHHLRANLADPDAAARWAHRAGTRALATHAPGAALSYFDRGLAVSRSGDASLRCDLWSGRLVALIGLGRFDGVDEALVQALDSADEIGDATRAARAVAAMSGVFVHRGSRKPLVGRLTRILDGLGRDQPTLRAALLAELSGLPSWAPPGARRAAALEALALARQGDDPAVLANALMQASWKVWDEPEKWLALATELVELGERCDRPDAVVAGSLRLGAYHLEHGEHAGFDECIDRVARIAALTALPHHGWAATSLRAARAAIRGRYTLSARLAEQALELLPDHPAALTTWYGETALRAILTDGLAEHVELGEAGIDESGDWTEVQLPYCGLAACHALVGNLEQARSALSRLLPGVAEWRRDPLWLPSVAFLAWTAVELKEATAAEQLYEHLAPFEDRMLTLNTGIPAGYWGCAAWVLGELAAALGRDDAARAHFEIAISRQASFGDRPWLAYVKSRYARLLTRLGDCESAEQARLLAEQARQAASELGLKRVLDQLEQLDHHACAFADQEGQSLIFRREGEYWAIGDPQAPSRVKNMRGLEHIARLLDNEGRDVHVFELAGGNGSDRRNVAADDDLHTDRSAADAVLDERAKTAYRRRIEDLREDIDEAEQHGDGERAARAREELDALTDHLAAALGLRGRDRRLGSDAERARVAVTKAIRTALDRIEAAEPAVASLLRYRIRTGMICRYEPPQTADPVRLVR